MIELVFETMIPCGWLKFSDQNGAEYVCITTDSFNGRLCSLDENDEVVSILDGSQYRLMTDSCEEGYIRADQFFDEM